MDSTPLIIALGNPGAEYASTRHNFGFLVADAILTLAQQRKSMALKPINAEGEYLLHSLVIGGKSCLLARPLTYMNLSGKAAARICGRHAVDPRDMIVLHDELDLPLGRMKLKRGGGANGHRGIESIAELTGTDDFMRLRLGIGRPQHSTEVKRYVLEPFPAADAETVELVCQAAVKGLTLYLRRGQAEAVQMLNSFRVPSAAEPTQPMDTSKALE